MRCSYCGGNLVREEAWADYPARVYCLQCGREPKPAAEIPRYNKIVISNPHICPGCKVEGVKFGKDRNRVQKFRCPRCQQTFLDGHWTKRKMVRDRVESYLRAGHGIRETARALGVTSQLSAKVYRGIGPLFCACGDEITHQGWCSVRFQASAKRKAFMKTWRDHGAHREREI